MYVDVLLVHSKMLPRVSKILQEIDIEVEGIKSGRGESDQVGLINSITPL